MKNLTIALIVSIVANLGAVLAVKYYRGQVRLVTAECVADAERAGREAADLVRAELEDVARIQRAELEARLRLEREATARLTALIEAESAEKIRIQRRLNDALQNQDNRDWWVVAVPDSLLDAAASGDETDDSEGSGADPNSPMPAGPVLTSRILDCHQWRLIPSLASREVGGAGLRRKSENCHRAMPAGT